MTTLFAEEQKTKVREAVAELTKFMTESDADPTRYDGKVHYEVDGGRKYLRIVMRHPGGSSRVHCFVESSTGDVYMAASFAKPMLNGARFSLLDAESFAELKDKWDPYGMYLYKNRNKS